MILQQLARYYDRAEDLAPDGWEWKRIPYIIDLTSDGEFVQLTSLRTGKKSTDVTASLVPKAEIRSGPRAFEKPNLLWDHYGFILGASKSDGDKDKENARQQLEHFRKRIDSLLNQGINDISLSAIKRFYETNEYTKIFGDPLWPECYKTPGCNLTFRLIDDNSIAIHRPGMRRIIDHTSKDPNSTNQQQGICLITGERTIIQQLHFPIAGVCEKPAPLAAVNDGASPAFSSFGKSKGYNFPVGESSVFKYTTALNHLLRPGSRQRAQVGDAIAIFWAQESKDSYIEDGFDAIFADADDPNALTSKVRALYESVHSGRFDGADGSSEFYVLGLAPNSARVVIRFWVAAPIRQIAKQILNWFNDLSIIRGPNDPEFPSLYRLLTAAALQNKIDNTPKNMTTDLMRSVLIGGELPAAWFNGILIRCRADQAKKSESGKPVSNVSYYRAAAIKAYLNRSIRLANSGMKEFTVGLDLTNTDPAYRLGRLFATYERIQSDAADRDLNRTVRDAYFGAAMSTPGSVFPRLIQLNQHHMRDLRRNKPGLYTVRDRLLNEIADGLDPKTAFRPTIPLKEQGAFALGYYHQRQAFFTKSDVAKNNGDSSTETTTQSTEGV